MNTDLDRAIESAVSDIVAAAPDITDDPNVVLITPTSAGATSRRLLPAAAAVLVVASGVTGIALASRGGPSQTGSAAAEQPVAAPLTDPASQPTAPATSEPADPATTAAHEPACSDGEGETIVPNVAGMAYPVAADTLLAAGLDFEVSREASPEGQPAIGDGHVVVAQDPTPGATVACGDVVNVMATTLPVYAIQPGDTWESIAAAQGIPVEDLLDFNDFTIVELEAAGGSITSPLEIGRVIRLSLRTSTGDTAPPTTG